MAQEVSITRSLTFNLSRYEKMTTTVTVTGIPMGTPAEDISAELDNIMSTEVARAAFATVHPPEDNVTSVYSWRQIIEEGMDA